MSDVAGSIWTHWHAHPEVLIGLSALEGGYLLGVGPLRERFRLAEMVPPRKVATFSMGVFVIFLSLVSPLHEISDRYLFSAHMLQHMLLTLVAPPLLILGTPDWLIRRLLRPDWAFRLARLGTHPVVALVVFNLVFSLWHIPALYNQAVNNHVVHVGQHLLMIATATLLWWPLTSTMPELPRLSYPLQIGYLFILSVVQIIVFAPLMFSDEPLYQWYVDAPRLWLSSPLVDQQIGAIIMKVGAGLLFISLVVFGFFRWYSEEQEKSKVEAFNREYNSDHAPAD